jgi:hypothetical protein
MHSAQSEVRKTSFKAVCGPSAAERWLIWFIRIGLLYPIDGLSAYQNEDVDYEAARFY